MANLDDLPDEILREVLTYDHLPRNRAVSRRFNDIEDILYDQRISMVKEIYPSMIDAIMIEDWNAVIFMIKYRDIFPLPLESGLYGVSIENLRRFWSILNPPKLSRQEIMMQLM
jgi:hypothetical protein